jgi:hypothetical protein
MAANQKLRRENPRLVPCPAAYLTGHSSAICRNISHFPALMAISSIFSKVA